MFFDSQFSAPCSGFDAYCFVFCFTEQCFCDIGYLSPGETKKIDLTIHCDDDQEVLTLSGEYDDKDGKKVLSDLCSPASGPYPVRDFSYILDKPGYYGFQVHASDGIGGKSQEYKMTVSSFNQPPTLMIRP